MFEIENIFMMLAGFAILFLMIAKYRQDVKDDKKAGRRVKGWRL